MSCPNSFEVSSTGRTPCRGPARFLQPSGVRRFRDSHTWVGGRAGIPSTALV